MTGTTARKKRQGPAKRKPESGLAYAITGGVLLLGTLGFVVFGRSEETPAAFAALAGGVTLGVWLFRWAHRAWITLPCLFASLAGCVVLGSLVDAVMGVAWMFGFVAGTNLGAGWRLAARRAPGARETKVGAKPMVARGQFKEPLPPQ